MGSNTIRLSIFSYEDSKITTVIQQKEVAGLAGYIKENQLEQEGIQKACDVLCDFKKIAMRFVDEKEIYAFATASLRGIRNREQALKMILQTTDLFPDVLSGEEEARLDFIGASHFTECTNGILIDIGGASTELVRFENAQPVRLASMPIGCLNLYTRFVGKIIPNGEERKKIKKEIREQLTNLGWSAEYNLPLMTGVGGTVRAAHKLSCGLFSLPQDQNEMDVGFIKEILNKLKNNENEIYRTVYKLIPERTLTIFTGLMIFNEAIKRFGCESIFVSGYGVREGYFIDRILKEGGAFSAA
jgi:exopolyphosphatase/guanosine-5'-triphosphate,3'-diphosphate pyrophosphatase